MPAPRSPHPNASALRSRRYTTRLRDAAAAAQQRADDLQGFLADAQAVVDSVPAPVLQFCQLGRQAELLRLIDIGQRAEASTGLQRRAVEWLLSAR